MSKSTNGTPPSGNGYPQDTSLVSFDDTNDNGAASSIADGNNDGHPNNSNGVVVPLADLEDGEDDE